MAENDLPADPAPTEAPSENSIKYKIFPRNLTARADYIVVGNPTNSRPEAGVDNCYPGLEFDQRNLDQRFFPGLRFYFHRADGARLLELPPDDQQYATVLTAADVATPLYLWGTYARFLVQVPEASMLSFQCQSGMEVWRRVHDLLPGSLAIVLGPTPGLSANLGDDQQAALKQAYQAAVAGGPASSQMVINRDAAGKLVYAVLANQRAPYLDADGVITPAVYPPGDITKTMCAPWMYDFRDCYCFYWSSNKPDIVKVNYEDEVVPYVNFLRQVEDRIGPPKADVDYYRKDINGTTAQRRNLELTYDNMVEGWWQKLPVVLSDTESTDGVARPARAYSDVAKQFDLNDILAELSYLATVEHALVVEYLYAYYSINTDAGTTGAPDDDTARARAPRISAAATQVFSIAVDEMRHLMWANLALRLLGGKPSVGRAKVIGEPPNPKRNNRRKLVKAKIKYLKQPFALKPLDRATLDWFINVEAPSQFINQGLDGMYVYILEALELHKDTIANADKVIPVIKLIIDEGEGHWERFSRIKETLSGISEDDYLRPLSQDPPSADQQEYLSVCDYYYHVSVKAIELSLTLGDTAQAQFVDAAVRFMRSLDDMAVVLARQGYLPRFNLPKEKKPTTHAGPRALAAARVVDEAAGALPSSASTQMSQFDALVKQVDQSLVKLRTVGSPDDRLRIARHRQMLAQNVADMDTIVTRDLKARADRT